jgi:hypothetical protein
MHVGATSVDKKGNPEAPAKVGLVEDGLGVNINGRGNGQDCGRIDVLSGGNTEKLTLELGDDVTGRLIQSVDFDFEAKYDAVVLIEFLLDGSTLPYSERIDLSDGSDSGPDAGSADKYPVTAPMAGNFLFDGVRISMISGGVSLEGGATWDSPKANRTVFNLLTALACGENTHDGGPDLTDNPLAALYVGPNKFGGDCEVFVDISTTNTSEDGQIVEIGPPAGQDAWTDVSGVVTIEWDIEAPTLLGVARTEQRILTPDTGDPEGTTTDEVIPWCEVDIPIVLASGEWFYELADNPLVPDDLYPDATAEDGDVCLIQQTTETVESAAGEIFTQTIEVYYLWADPIWTRK